MESYHAAPEAEAPHWERGGGRAVGAPPPSLPALPEVSRRLAAAQFVCVAACYVAKPHVGGPAAVGGGEDARILAVGYEAGLPSAPQLLKLSATPAFSLMPWATCAHGAACRHAAPCR